MGNGLGGMGRVIGTEKAWVHFPFPLLTLSAAASAVVIEAINLSGSPIEHWG
jgi:hypothetical protein